ncbi:hypothetical protein [Cyanobium sp. ULC082]
MSHPVVSTAYQALVEPAPVQPRITRVRGLVLALPWVGFVVQCFLASTSTDILCSLLAATGSYLLLYDCFREIRFLRFPLSTLVLIGFAVTLQLGPLLFTAMEGNSITNILQVPYTTFSHSLVVSAVCILAHWIYRNSAILYQLKAAVQHIMLRLYIFKPLHSSEVIWMGALGTFALAVSSWFNNQVTNTIVLKFIVGFDFLSIIPASFLLCRLLGMNDRLERNKFVQPLLIYLGFQALIVVTSVGRGARGPFLVPIVCLIIGFAFEWLYGLIRIRLSIFISLALVLLLALPTVTDLATAIVMARFLRGDIPAQELLAVTLELMKDRETLRQYTIGKTLKLSEDRNDTYVSNLFLARFVNARYPDISLTFSQRITPQAGLQMARIQFLRVVSIFPGPVLDLFGLAKLKDLALSGSMGDFLMSLANTGSIYMVGGFFAGHFFGTGMAGFGYGYLIILLLGLLLVFPLLDSHALLSSHMIPVFSAVAITQLFPWLTFSSSESVASFFIFSFRTFFEPILLFFLVRSTLAFFKAV